MKLVADIGTVFARELRPTLREPFSLIFGMIQPLVLLALFGPLLSSTIGDTGASAGALHGSGDGIWQWFVPGILIMLAVFGTSMTGSNLQIEIQSGAHERLLVTPLSRSSLLVGRALKEMAPLTVQAVIIIAVMIPFGFELHPLGALLGLAILAVLGVGIGALSYTLALAARKQEWVFWTVQQTLLFPLLILSGLLMPLDDAPGWMKTMARFNPVHYVTEAERALFAGEVATRSVLWGALAAVGAAAVGLLLTEIELAKRRIGVAAGRPSHRLLLPLLPAASLQLSSLQLFFRAVLYSFLTTRSLQPLPPASPA